jgi:hypothetical protein
MKSVLKQANDPELLKLKVNCSNDTQMVREGLRVPPLIRTFDFSKSADEKKLIKRTKLFKSNALLKEQFINAIVGYKNKIKFNIVLKIA